MLCLRFCFLCLIDTPPDPTGGWRTPPAPSTARRASASASTGAARPCEAGWELCCCTGTVSKPSLGLTPAPGVWQVHSRRRHNACGALPGGNASGSCHQNSHQSSHGLQCLASEAMKRSSWDGVQLVRLALKHHAFLRRMSVSDGLI